MNQMPGVASNQQFDGVVQGLIGCFGDQVSLTEGAKQKSTRSPLTMMRAKPFATVCSEGANLVFVEFLKGDPFCREPFVQLNHDPNDALTGIPCVAFVHELAGKTIQVWAKWPTTAATQEFRI